MSKIASSPWIAIVAAGAALANPGGFIPLAMKEISETNPSTARYIVEWVFFSVVSLLPLAVALILLAVSRDWATRLLGRVRDWLVRNARLIAAAIMVLLAAVLLRNGISGLTQCPDRGFLLKSPTSRRPPPRAPPTWPRSGETTNAPAVAAGADEIKTEILDKGVSGRACSGSSTRLTTSTPRCCSHHGIPAPTMSASKPLSWPSPTS